MRIGIGYAFILAHYLASHIYLCPGTPNPVSELIDRGSVEGYVGVV